MRQTTRPAPQRLSPSSGSPSAERWKKESPGQHARALDQPVVEHALLRRRRVQRVPGVDAAARRAQPGQPQLGAVAVGDGGQGIELLDVLAGDHDADLEGPEAGRGEVVHGRPGGGERALAAHGVVGGGGGAVDADLHVEVVEGGQAAGSLGRQPWSRWSRT